MSNISIGLDCSKTPLDDKPRVSSWGKQVRGTAPPGSGGCTLSECTDERYPYLTEDSPCLVQSCIDPAIRKAGRRVADCAVTAFFDCAQCEHESVLQLHPLTLPQQPITDGFAESSTCLIKRRLGAADERRPLQRLLSRRLCRPQLRRQRHARPGWLIAAAGVGVAPPGTAPRPQVRQVPAAPAAISVLTIQNP
jgi:hypothetical protein